MKVRARVKGIITAQNLLLFGTTLLAAGAMSAQEPALLQGGEAVRYEEAHGDFHYVFPCRFPAAGSAAAGSSATPATGIPAICWPAYLGQIRMVDGKAQSSPPTPGVLMVSNSLVRFTPQDSKASQIMPDTAPSQISFSYDAKHVVAGMQTKDGLYAFTFQAICKGCTPGTSPIDPSKGAQLESEYREFQQSLIQFEVVSKRINDLASQMPFALTPKNQPSVEDVPAAMALYSDLNHRLAPLCPEAARPCVQSYERYQACKSADLKADCGAAPSCTAVCPLAADAWRGLKATFCRSPKLDYAALVPDWTPVAEKMDAARAARGPIDPKTIHIEPAPAGPPRDFMGKPDDPDNPCSAESSYAMAMMSHMTATGIAGISADRAKGRLDGSGKVPVSGGVMAANILVKTKPQYPAVARAARVQGTVVLQAIISKTGSVEDLAVIAGPPLLQQAAVDAVKTWKYRPYLVNGTAVDVATLINVVFSLGIPERAPNLPVPAQ